MFTLEESALFRRMIRVLFVGVFVILAAAAYYFLIP
jgi:hypothetical protein